MGQIEFFLSTRKGAVVKDSSFCGSFGVVRLAWFVCRNFAQMPYQVIYRIRTGSPLLLSVLAASLCLPLVGTCWARKARASPYISKFDGPYGDMIHGAAACGLRTADSPPASPYISK